MRNITTFRDFVNEAKGFDPTPKAPKKEIENEVKAIIKELFANAEDDEGKNVQRSITFTRDDDGVPTTVTFEVHPSDYGIGYPDKLEIERSAAVAAKRAFNVYLAPKPEKEKKEGKYIMTFEIGVDEKNDPQRMAIIKYSKYSTKQLKELDMEKLSDVDKKVVDGILDYRKTRYKRKKA